LYPLIEYRLLPSPQHPVLFRQRRCFESVALTGSLLAKSRQLWPFSAKLIFLARKNMTRIFALSFAALILLAGAGHARAQGLDMRDIMEVAPISASAAQALFRGRPCASPAIISPGTILIDTAERRLTSSSATARRCGTASVSAATAFRWGGVHRISAKKEWPSWTPPSQKMLARRPDLPRHMAGGIENPLGARAMYLGSTLYRIHGSNDRRRSARRYRPGVSA